MQEATIVCKNCGNQFHGKFCNNCGEKVYTEHDKTFNHFLGDTFHFITHWDNKLIKSWWLVMSRPGFVSAQIAEGIRKPYYKPANLFIIGVILYLLFPFFQGLNMPMKFHMSELYGEIADNMITQKMAVKHWTLDQVAEKFDHKSPAFAKLLLLIIIPLSAFALQLMFRGKKRYFFDHITLASELNTFYLFFTFFGIPVLFIIAYFAAKVFTGQEIQSYLGDDISVPLHLTVFGIYSVIAFKRFYNEKTFRAILKTALFLGAHWLIVYTLYRFILFCLVMLFI